MSKVRLPRIFWFSNSPEAGTGYGTQSAQVLRRMRKRGHPTVAHANYGQAMGVGRWDGIRVFPQGYDGFSQDVIMSHYNTVKAEHDSELLMVTLCDVWVLKNPGLQKLERIWSWVPIDHAGMVPEVGKWLKRDNVLPIAMSEHGLAAMQRVDIDGVYIPHALERHWKPTRFEEDPFPGRFVVIIPNANKGQLPSRKAWGENLLAFGVFAQKHPEALLYLHTEARSPFGIDLLALIEAAKISPDQVTFVDQYEHRMGVPDRTMAQLYTRADVLLSATAGEGFGLPVLEAQACGTRVVVSDFSAQPELVGDGFKAQVQPQWNPTQLGWFATPLVHSILEGLEWAYEQGGGHSQQAVEFARQYDADRVFADRWVPLLDA